MPRVYQKKKPGLKWITLKRIDLCNFLLVPKIKKIYVLHLHYFWIDFLAHPRHGQYRLLTYVMNVYLQNMNMRVRFPPMDQNFSCVFVYSKISLDTNFSVNYQFFYVTDVTSKSNLRLCFHWKFIFWWIFKYFSSICRGKMYLDVVKMMKGWIENWGCWNAGTKETLKTVHSPPSLR
jgi:hypothetical protein